MKQEFDETSGQHTTGHEWNGIKELNTPMPRAFRVWLWGSIAVAALFWLLYPSFPYVTGALQGVLGYSARQDVVASVALGQSTREASFAALAETPLEDLAQDAALRAENEAAFSVLFRDNCAACHGRDATGQVGFPNLTDDHWLWSGTAEEIEYTLQVGINADHDDTRYAQMPAFGRDQLLSYEEMDAVTDYVLSLSGRAHDAQAAAAGAILFEDTCAACHNDAGAGGYENGAPSLADQAWIYGGSRSAILETLQNGRGGVMPAWSGRLTDTEIRQLTLYLLWQGQPDD